MSLCYLTATLFYVVCDMPKKADHERQKQIDTVVRLLRSGQTQAAAAKSVGVTLRTIQRWLAEPDIKARLQDMELQHQAIAKSDPVVLSVVEIREQVQQILDYRSSQRMFAVEMSVVIQKATKALKAAVERLEENPDELSTRTIPPMIRALADASEKVSNAWARVTGLEDLLEVVGNEPQADSAGKEIA